MNILNLLIDDREQVELSDIFLSEDNRQQILQLIKEQKYADELLKYDLPINNKVFLFGNSGCGKTTTAKAIATALKKPVYILNLSNIVSSKIGETGQNLKLIFDKASRDKAVLFLDEFDQIGKARGNDDKDVGEMRRLVNTIIQLIDYFPKNALLICASNHPQIIDIALMRRFQLKISFELPSDEVLNEYYDAILSHFPENLRSINRRFGISFAEAKDYAYTIIKGNIINQLEKINNNA
jgi:ATPase central domain protein